MRDRTELYNIYKEYAWREYDLLQKRSNWLYVFNSVFAAALVYVFQQQLSLAEHREAIEAIRNDGYLRTIYVASKAAAIVVPLAAIATNFVIWRMMSLTRETIEGIRLKWREVLLASEDAGCLPFVTYGFHDEGDRTANDRTALSFLPLFLVFCWTLVLMLAGWSILAK